MELLWGSEDSFLGSPVILVNKAYFNLGPKYTCDMFTKSNQVYSTRNDKMLVQPKCFSFNHGIYSFRYEGARLWNSLDPHFKDVDSLSNFKVSLRKLQGGDCMFLCVFLVCAAEQLNRKLMTLHALLCHCIYHRASSISYRSITILLISAIFPHCRVNSTVY